MSLSAGRNMLRGAVKDLLVKWEQARLGWDDPMSQELEKFHLAPLEPKARNALAAMDKMTELVAQARRECE